MTKASKVATDSAALQKRFEVLSIVHHLLAKGGNDAHQQLYASLGFLPEQLLEVRVPNLHRQHRVQGGGGTHSLSLVDQRQLAEVLPWSQFTERGLLACLVFRRQLHPPLCQHQKRIADHLFCEQGASGGEFPFNR